MNNPIKDKTHPLAIKADDIMSEVVVTVSCDTPVRDAAHLMLRDRISGLPVIDEKKNIIGMLTLTNLFVLVSQAAEGDNYDFYKKLFHEKEMKVSEVMSKTIHSVSPETTLEEIIHIALTEQIYTLPVMKDKKLVGVIGRHDMLNAIFAF